MRKLVFIILIIFSHNVSMYGQSKNTFSGYIKDTETGEELIGAAIYFNELKTGAITNSYGFFSISLASNTYKVKISYMGYETQFLDLELTKNIRKDIQLKPLDKALEEVNIFAERADENVSSNEMSINKLEMKTIVITLNGRT